MFQQAPLIGALQIIKVGFFFYSNDVYLYELALVTEEKNRLIVSYEPVEMQNLIKDKMVVEEYTAEKERKSINQNETVEYYENSSIKQCNLIN